MSSIIAANAAANRAASFRNNNFANVTQSEIDNRKAEIQRMVDRIKGELNMSGTTYPMDNNPYKTYDNRYTVEDAETQTTVVGSAIGMSIFGSTLDDLKLVDTTSDEYVGTDNFWENMSHSICGLYGWSGTSEASSNLGNAVESLAARYVSVRQKLESKFSGDELETQLQKLDETFNKAADDMSKQAVVLGKVKNNVKSAFRSQADAYYNFAIRNPGYEDKALAGKDSNLRENDTLMASLLKDAYAASGASSTSGVRDLKAASDIANVLLRNDGYIFRGANEGEDFGLLAGVESMKIDAVLEKYGASEEIREHAYSQLTKHLDMAIRQSEREANFMVPDKFKVTVDRRETQRIMDYIRKEWLTARGNIEATLKKAGALIGSPYKTTDRSSFSKNFFKIDKSTYAHMPEAAAYATPHYDEILADWQKFAAAQI